MISELEALEQCSAGDRMTVRRIKASDERGRYCQNRSPDAWWKFMETSRMTLGRILALIGVALLVLLTNIAASVLYMVLYGHLIDPGHEPKYYQDHIQLAGPYCSIVAGMPIMFFAGWWVAGWWRRSLEYRGAILVWLAYTIIDLSVLVIAGLSLAVGLLFAVSFATKLAAVYWGASMRLRNHAEQSDPAKSPVGPA